MKNRIRSAAIIVRDNKILLVKHVHPKTGFVWWVPPGGGIEESDESLNGQISCACACESKQQMRYRIQSLFHNKPFDWEGWQNEAPLLTEMPYATTSMAASV